MLWYNVYIKLINSHNKDSEKGDEAPQNEEKAAKAPQQEIGDDKDGEVDKPANDAGDEGDEDYEEGLSLTLLSGTYTI